MRLFIALDFSTLKDYLTEVQNSIKDLAKMTLPKDFHLTLKFLGEVPEDKISKIKETLNNISFNKFSVELDNAGFFPSESYIRVVWVGIKPIDKVNELQKLIDNSLSQIFSKDSRFHLHITIARVKFIKDKKQFIETIKSIKLENKKIDINDFRLIKSTLTPDGPIYKDLDVLGLE